MNPVRTPEDQQHRRQQHEAYEGRVEQDLYRQADAQLIVTEKAISKHTGNIFMKVDHGTDDDNRRVLAVIADLRS